MVMVNNNKLRIVTKQFRDWGRIGEDVQFDPEKFCYRHLAELRSHSSERHRQYTATGSSAQSLLKILLAIQILLAHQKIGSHCGGSQWRTARLAGMSNKMTSASEYRL